MKYGQEFVAMDTNQDQPAVTGQRSQQLTAWVTNRLRTWRQARDQTFRTKWQEYYRIYKGIFSAVDQTRRSERSKIIVPATAEAVDTGVADIEEAVFGRKMWFDLEDDFRGKIQQQLRELMEQLKATQGADAQQALQEQINAVTGLKDNLEMLRQQLLEDARTDGVPAAACEAILNGALYGTSIGKILVEEQETQTPSLMTNEEMGQYVGTQTEKRVAVPLESVAPWNFVIDPAVNRPGYYGIMQALGCASEVFVPTHTIKGKQRKGYYRDTPMGFSSPQDIVSPTHTGQYHTTQKTTINEDTDMSALSDNVKIAEYWGLVPKVLITDKVNPDGTLKPIEEDKPISWQDVEESDLVEACVIIANDSVLLKGIENPFIMKDRPFIASPWYVDPEKFWGMGIVEKVYHPQKALDAEERSRIDAMGYSSHPMMAVDATGLPRGANMGVYPGRTFLTTRNPKDVFQNLQFSGPSAGTFHQTGELQNMLRQAAGVFGQIIPMASGNIQQSQTAMGQSMLMGGTVKRAKRVLRNFEEMFLTPLVVKLAWRYQQFDPDRYPAQDYKFCAYGAFGTMAREVEQHQLIYLLSMIPQDNPAFGIILRSIIEYSSIAKEGQILDHLETLFQVSPEQQQLAQLEIQEKMMQLRYLEAQTDEKLTAAVKNFAAAGYSSDRLNVEILRELLERDADMRTINQEQLGEVRKELVNRYLNLLEKSNNEQTGNQTATDENTG